MRLSQAWNKIMLLLCGEVKPGYTVEQLEWGDRKTKSFKKMKLWRGVYTVEAFNVKIITNIRKYLFTCLSESNALYKLK